MSEADKVKIDQESTVEGDVSGDSVELTDSTVEGDVYTDGTFDCEDSTIDGQSCDDYDAQDESDY